MGAGTAMAGSLGLRSSIYPVHFFGHVYGVYAALPALLVNLGVAAVVSLVMKMAGSTPAEDLTATAA
jgi:SSS family solute:Na+ symporter